ncbi:SacI homology domain-containing protein, partial [Lineolata rhizophorae]
MDQPRRSDPGESAADATTSHGPSATAAPQHDDDASPPAEPAVATTAPGRGSGEATTPTASKPQLVISPPTESLLQDDQLVKGKTQQQQQQQSQQQSQQPKTQDEDAAAATAAAEQSPVELEGDEEEPAEPTSFQRSSSPAAMQRNKSAVYEKVGEEGINKMHKFSLYETSTRFYLVGADIVDRQFRVLKIDRTAPPGNLTIFEDDIVYDRREMNQLLNAIDDGNKGAGGMKLKRTLWGVLGFIRFTDAYYMLVITKRTQVAMIGGHYIYQVDGTELVPLTTGSTSRFQRDRNPEEARFLSILNNLDLTRSFYFSYSYNITKSLQQNIIREREAMNQGVRGPTPDFNDMFVWNHYLLQPALSALKSTYDWCLPIIHGFVDQSYIDVFGRSVYITIIARRSRFFAGARFLKRGANDLGYVANDVETEQIVSELTTTSFHAPGPRLYANPAYTSYIQHRGSIPLYWTQDNTGVSPKPDIDLNLVDPFYSAAALHFDNLFERYGAPIFALNLIKARERTPRESKLLYEYQNAVQYLNQSLPEDKKIIYKAFDMSRASKTRGHDVIGTLEAIAEDILQKTGFFHNGDTSLEVPRVQNGVARTNCIDCLDRTNAAQFVIGKRALGRQLQALGVIAGNTVEYDTDCVNIFTHMFHDHGDTIAIQYGGSHLVNTMETYRKINHWQSHSRDMVESFKRYYNNSFLDSQRQEAYNLFLGNYIFAQGQPMLWDLPTDYYLHHSDPRAWSGKRRRNYWQWWTPANMEPRALPASQGPETPVLERGLSFIDDFWQEYYRPLALSSFLKLFAYKKMALNARYIPEKTLQAGRYDLSPFRPRKGPIEHESPDKKPRKGVTILDPHSEEEKQRPSSQLGPPMHHRYPPMMGEISPAKAGILRPDPQFDAGFAQRQQQQYARQQQRRHAAPLSGAASSSGAFLAPPPPADKSLMTQWTLNDFVANSLNPSVSAAEADEYAEYVSHPQNLP